MGKLVSLADLSEFLGRSERTLIEDTDAGMPCVERGGAGRPSVYDTAQVVTWLLAREAARRDATVEAERRRLVASQADLSELRAAERAGELVELEAFRRGALRAARELTERLLTLADALAPTLDPRDPPRAQKLVAEAIETTLSRVAGFLESLGVGLDPHPPPSRAGIAEPDINVAPPAAAPRSQARRNWATDWRPR